MNNPIRILHLEDNSNDTELITFVLQQHPLNFILLRVDNKDEFIKHLTEFNPDIILADQTLPGFDGISALKISKTKDITIPFIFVTGTMDDEIAVQTIKLGADDYIIKDRLSRLPTSIIQALDIAQKKVNSLKTLHDLELAEQKFHTIFQSSADSLIIQKENLFIDCNPATLQLFGCTAFEEVLGQPILKFFNEFNTENKSIIEYCQLAFNGPTQHFEWICCKLNKEEFYVDVVMTNILIEEQPVLHISIRDISYTKKNQLEIQQHAMQLQNTFLQTVQLITKLNEVRDPYTTGHEQRVAELAVAIGKQLKLTELQLIGIRVCGYLHDIGKIAIPIEILTKPGKLTNLELDFIQTHSENGYNILKNIDFPWAAAQVAYQHHERLDGSGYPRGLTDKDIMFEAQIIAVADVIEAMLSHRPYRPGLGMEAALNELIQGRGKLYDPVIVDICVNLFKEQNFQFI